MSIRFVLVGTQHRGNIGSAARAMKVMGFDELRLVRPVDFPSTDATAMAAGAADVLAGAAVFDSVDQAVADCGLKSLGMDHGNPTVEGGSVWFCSDEHTTFGPDNPAKVGDRVRVTPAHIDPTIAYHERMHLVDGERVVETWPVDLRGW